MAVFLALAVGIIAGSTVVDQQLIKGLQRQRNVDQAIKEELRVDSEVLRAEVALWQSYGDDLLLPSLRGQLNGTTVAIVVPPFTPDETRVAIRDGLRSAGATIAGELRFGPRILVKDHTAAEQLRIAIDAPEADGDELVRAAGRTIGASFGPGMLDRWTSGPLVDADMISVEERGSAAVRPTVIVVLWDATTENAILATTLLPSLLGGAAEAGARVVVAETLAQEPSLVTRVRDADGLRTRVATVDHAATTLGSVALAAAIADIASTGTVDHFGVLPGNQGALPGRPSPTPKPSAKATTKRTASPSAASSPPSSR